MKLATTYKNPAPEGISASLREELDQAVTEANKLLAQHEGKAAVIAFPESVTTLDAKDLYAQMTTHKIDAHIFVAAQKEPDEGYARLVFVLDSGQGVVDVLIETE